MLLPGHTTFQEVPYGQDPTPTSLLLLSGVQTSFRLLRFLQSFVSTNSQDDTLFALVIPLIGGGVLSTAYSRSTPPPLKTPSTRAI